VSSFLFLIFAVLLNCKDSEFCYFFLLKLCDMSKNMLIFEFSPGAHIIYTALKKLLWQPFTKQYTTTLLFFSSSVRCRKLMSSMV